MNKNKHIVVSCLFIILIILFVCANFVTAGIPLEREPYAKVSIEVVDKNTNLVIEKPILFIKILYSPPNDYLNYNYTEEMFTSPKQVLINMQLPRIELEAQVIAMKEGYLSSDPIIIRSKDFWEVYNRTGEYLVDHTFYLTSVSGVSEITQSGIPPPYKSFLYTKIINKNTGESIEPIRLNFSFFIGPPINDTYKKSYIIQNSSEKLLLGFPSSQFNSTAYIIATKEGYLPSEPLIINSSFYWSMVKKYPNGFFINYTFCLTPIQQSTEIANIECVENNTFSFTPIQPTSTEQQPKSGELQTTSPKGLFRFEIILGIFVVLLVLLIVLHISLRKNLMFYFIVNSFE